ncbi:MAG: proline--tRNA ligase [Bdellovibrionota bacterium]
MAVKWSKTHLYTLREAPTDAEIPSHQLMVRAGLIRKVAPGMYTYGNFALRAIRKFESIVRDELDSRGCQEILMPMVHPAELWQETGRWTEMGAGLLKFKNRNGHDFCLGATHEEVVTDYVRKDVKSYRDLPVNLYQIQTKYRDEIRPRFGLMRGREFSMKDAYSFDADEAGALKSYDAMYDGYKSIFNRLGVKYRIVQADAGNIGGSKTHEFQLLADAGEDHLMVCDKCDFAANIEVAPALYDAKPNGSAELPKESFPTPGLKQIATLAKSLKVEERELVKTLFFSANDGTDPNNKDLKAVCVLLRGNDELNPVKLKNMLGISNPPLMLTDEEVKKTSGAWPGSCGPVGLTIPIYMDTAVSDMKNFVVGANKDAEHLKNVNIGRDFKPTQTGDLRMAKAGDICPSCKAGKYQSFRGIEVGHVFYLGNKYSKAMQANFLNEAGETKPIEMGCYGIGVTRTVQAAIEQNHDKDGIIWPVPIAPFQVHIVVLDPENGEVMQAAEIVTRDLEARGHDVFVDDRAERPGVKFKDADLLGMPVRLNIGGRGLQAGEIEIINRRTKEMQKVKVENTVEKTSELLRELART